MRSGRAAEGVPALVQPHAREARGRMDRWRGLAKPGVRAIVQANGRKRRLGGGGDPPAVGFAVCARWMDAGGAVVIIVMCDGNRNSPE